MDSKNRTKWIAVAIAASLAAGAPIGCGGDSDSTTEASVFRCKQVDPPKPKDANYRAPKQTVTAGEKLTAIVKTSCGSFEIALDTERAPKTVNSFVFLSEKGFYDGLAFDRVVRPGSLLLGGDPPGRSGDAGYSVEEPPPSGTDYTKGVVAMVKGSAEPSGQSGSQFFVVLSADADLPPEYALIGDVDKGFDLVEQIGKRSTASEKRRQTILIESIWAKEG